MPCELVNIGGQHAIVCSRTRRPQWCQFCRRRPSTKLCDFPESGRTCDASICDECATPAGNNIDYCPTHKGEVKQWSLF